ncbi:MAG: aryl-sulfate sulfotransferase [Promethearchaeota archaeon]
MTMRFSTIQGFLRSFFCIVFIIVLIFPYSQSVISLVNASQIKIQSGTSQDPILKRELKLNLGENRSYVNLSGAAFDGYNIFQLRDFVNQEYSFLITDMDGNIVNEFPSGANYGFGHLINSTTFLLLSSQPIYLWNIETDKIVSIPSNSLHDISYNPFSNTFMTLSSYYIDYFDLEKTTIDTYRYDALCERNMAGEEIWRLNTSTFIPLDWWSGEFTGPNRDITHSNTAFWDIEEDIIYLNCRNINTFYKIDHATGEVLWGLGEHGDFTLFDHWGNKQQNLFYHAHAVEKVNDNTFILFDNDYRNKSDSDNHRSRILEITIDEMTMKAWISWLWTGSDEYYTEYWGDADRLPNGNRFGTFGSKTHDATTIGPRLVEVDEVGNIVWEMYYKGGSLGIYQAERFRLSPILSSPQDRFLQTGDSIILSWQTWYNFRTKLKMNGSYTFFHNGNLTATGNHVFDKFWRPTTLNFNVNSLEKGVHNFSLVVADEGGHTTVDTVLAYVDVLPPTTTSTTTSNSTITSTSSSVNTTNSVPAATTIIFLLGLGVRLFIQKKSKWK